MTEFEHQKHIIQWAKQLEKRHPELWLLNGSLNGIPIRPQTIGKVRASGVKAGFPDLFLPVKTKTYSGLFIELKTEKGKVSPKQREWLDELQKQGFKAIVCFGSDSAIKEIKKYLRIKV